MCIKIISKYLRYTSGVCVRKSEDSSKTKRMMKHISKIISVAQDFLGLLSVGLNLEVIIHCYSD